MGRFWEPGIGIFGVRPKYICPGVPSIGFELGVLFRKNPILWSDCPFSFGFFLTMFLNECTKDSSKPFNSPF